MWNLRAGRETAGVTSVMGASFYIRAKMSFMVEFSDDDLLRAIRGGDNSMAVPLTALLVSEGRTGSAEIYWELQGQELPATRNELLDALSWFGRYELYPAMALNPAIPPDMEGTMHSDQCGAVCALGWMVIREDGLFHGDELVSPSDIQILSIYFPGVNSAMKYIPASSLEYLFLTGAGASR
ncbi:MAG: hypothetical protein KAR40_05130 [Candidatus Sabulitectum sp.]|nr:hypothetical protein [Candidatus Sabulitectum sp.]